MDETAPKLIEGLQPEDLRAHLYLLGGGAWRQDLALDLAINLITQGYGLCFLDRTGQASTHLLKAIAPELTQDTFYWNVGDRKRHAGLNLLQTTHKDDRYAVVEMLLLAFQSLFGTDAVGHRSAYLLTNFALALMDLPDSTIYSLRPLLTNEKYRAYIRSRAKSRDVKDFWQEFARFEENSKLLLEITAPLLNKLGALFFNPLVRNIFAQTTSTVDFGYLMRASKIIIINLAEQRIGARQAALVGNLILANLRLATTKRAASAKDFFLFIPDYHTYAETLIGDFLSNTANRLNLVIDSQTIANRRQEFSKCGNFITFKCSTDDLGMIVSELADPRYEERKLMESLTLSGRRICGRLLDWDSGSFTPPFDSTVKPLSYRQAGRIDSIKKYSAMRYCRRRDIIEDKLARFAQTWGEQPET